MLSPLFEAGPETVAWLLPLGITLHDSGQGHAGALDPDFGDGLAGLLTGVDVSDDLRGESV